MPSARCSGFSHTGQSRGNDHGSESLRALRQHRSHHLGDHLAGPAHDHRVTGPHVLGRHLVLVVERGGRHRHPAHEHRLEPGEGRGLPRRADRHLDVEQLGGTLLRRELVGDGPAGGLGVDPQLCLEREIVDLYDQAVELVVELVAAALVVGHMGLHRSQIVQAGRVLVDGQAQRRQPVQRLHVGTEGGPALGVAELVAPERQAPLGGHPGILLAKRAGGRIAGVDICLLAPLDLAGVEPLEGGETQDHLATHFEDWGGRPAEPDGYVGDGAHRVSYVLAGASVAPSGGPNQHAVDIAHRDGQPVELQLHRVRTDGGVLHGRQALLSTRAGRAGSQGAMHPLVPGAQLFEVERIVERHHGLLVAHRREHGVVRRGAHALGGRVGMDQLGVTCLQGLQLVEQVVEVGVGYLGLARVVERRMVIEQSLQLANTGRGADGCSRVGAGRFGHRLRLHLPCAALPLLGDTIATVRGDARSSGRNRDRTALRVRAGVVAAWLAVGVAAFLGDVITPALRPTDDAAHVPR